MTHIHVYRDTHTDICRYRGIKVNAVLSSKNSPAFKRVASAAHDKQWQRQAVKAIEMPVKYTHTYTCTHIYIYTYTESATCRGNKNQFHS